MCGIVGLWRPSVFQEDVPSLLEGMLGVIEHRGPDEFGYYFDNEVGLGSARLAIIDLHTGTQPISTEDERFWIVFNGEIFNYVELRTELAGLGYQFRTQADTEVLLLALVAWGTQALSRLDGQFAFAFYDKQSRKLLLARDPFGERPLFYTTINGGIAFASEIKALFYSDCVPRSLSSAGLSMAYFAWTVPPEETCFEGIHQIPHGHFMEISATGISINRYYRLRCSVTSTAGDLEEAAEQTRNVLDVSLQRRLRADIPVGTYMSGGLDSTIVTALARKHLPGELQTFSIEFNHGSFDESDWQRQAQRQLGTTHHALKISEADIASNFSDAIWHAETVQFRTALVPMLLLSRAVKEQGLKVVLTGEGADEAFLGYDIFKELVLRRQWSLFSSDAERLHALESIYHYLPGFDENSRRVMLGYFRRYLEVRTPGLFAHEARLANGQAALHLLQETESEEVLRERLVEILRRHGRSDLDDIASAQALEYDMLLAGYLLSSQGDRMVAANGVEGRSPFLSTAVVDFANSLPIGYRLGNGFEEKLILKKAFEQIIPATITKRIKQPYRAPGASCFFGAGAPTWVTELLEPQHLMDVGVFNVDNALRIVEKIRKASLHQISARDDQAFILLLSTVLLWEQFIRSPRPIPKPIANRINRRIDRCADA